MDILNVALSEVNWRWILVFFPVLDLVKLLTTFVKKIVYEHTSNCQELHKLYDLSVVHFIMLSKLKR